MQEIALSKHGIPIRLTDERWTHITEEHCEIAGLRLDILETVSNPLMICEGKEGVLFAIREIGLKRYLVVVYRELHDDGFIITSFITSRKGFFQRRKQIWPA